MIELDCRQEWYQPFHVQMEGKFQQVLEEGSESCHDILWKFLCRERAITSMPEGVVRRLLNETYEV